MDRIVESVSKCTTLVEKLISSDKEREKTKQQSDSLNGAVKPSYAEIVSDKSSVILKPKIDTHQSVSVTKKDLLVNIDPVKSNIKISKVSDGRDGSVIITCDNSDDSNKIKEMISNNLPNYTFKQLSTLNPKIRISSIDDSIKQEQLLHYVVNQNKSLFGTNYTCKLIKFCKQRNNASRFQAVLEVDVKSYKSILDSGKLLIGYSYCRVWDAVDIRRCFNCSRFHHLSKHCFQSEPTCPKCSQNHLLKNCSATNLTCINCTSLKAKHPDIDVNHAAWDTSNCTAYKTQLGILRDRMLNNK
jgi:hypothetical protein